MVAELQTIFCVARKIVPAVRTIFSFQKTAVFGIETVVWVIQTVFATTKTTVTAARKAVSVAPTIFCVSNKASSPTFRRTSISVPDSFALALAKEHQWMLP